MADAQQIGQGTPKRSSLSSVFGWRCCSPVLVFCAVQLNVCGHLDLVPLAVGGAVAMFP